MGIAHLYVARSYVVPHSSDRENVDVHCSISAIGHGYRIFVCFRVRMIFRTL